MERQLRGIGPGECKFDTKKLNNLMMKVREQRGCIKTEIAENRLTVETIQKYFGMLSNENDVTITAEFNVMISSMQQSHGAQQIIQEILNKIL